MEAVVETASKPPFQHNFEKRTDSPTPATPVGATPRSISPQPSSFQTTPTTQGAKQKTSLPSGSPALRLKWTVLRQPRKIIFLLVALVMMYQLPTYFYFDDKTSAPSSFETLTERVHFWRHEARQRPKGPVGSTSVVIPVRDLSLPDDVLDDLRLFAETSARRGPSPQSFNHSLLEVILVVQTPTMKLYLSKRIIGPYTDGRIRIVLPLAGRGQADGKQRDEEAVLQELGAAELVAYGAYSANAENVLILYPSHYPQSSATLGPALTSAVAMESSNSAVEIGLNGRMSSVELFVRRMVFEAETVSRQQELGRRTTQQNGITGVFSCSVVEALGPHPSIHSHGFEMVFGRTNDGEDTVFLQRALYGFTHKDQRFQRSSVRDFISQHCLLAPASFFSHYSVEKAFAGAPTHHDVTSAHKNHFGVDVNEWIAVRIKTIELVSDKLTSLLNPLKASTLTADFSTSVSHAFRSVRRADQALITLRRLVTASANSMRARKPEVDLQPILNGKKEPEMLSALAEELDRLCEVTQRILRTLELGNFDAEETLGWELSIVARERKLPVVVLPTPVFIRHALIRRAPNTPNATTQVNLNGRFARAHPNYFTRYRASLTKQVAPIRVAWDTYCCHCCGFTNEIVHLIVPLQQKYDVLLMAGAECFCPGFPISVSDTIERLYSPKLVYTNTRAQEDEILVWVSHRDPGALQFIAQDYPTRKPDFIVTRTMYEFTKLLPHWVKGANELADEVWVPGEWVKKVYIQNGVAAEKLVVIPEAIDTDFFAPGLHGKVSLPFNATEDRSFHTWCNLPFAKTQKSHYKFLSDFKFEPRKGWDILLEAYFSQFTANEPVSLYILTHLWFPEGHYDKHNITLLLELVTNFTNVRFGNSTALSTFPHFCFLMKSMQETEVAQLYHSVDAFVLPTRGEGWGLPTMQAMSMGLPTISTDWGGQTEFMTADTSFMIPLDGVEELPEVTPYDWAPAKKWGTPSSLVTGKYMRAVFDDPEYGRIVGRRARGAIVARFSEPALQKVLDERLQAIRQKVLKQRGSSDVYSDGLVVKSAIESTHEILSSCFIKFDLRLRLLSPRGGKWMFFVGEMEYQDLATCSRC